MGLLTIPGVAAQGSSRAKPTGLSNTAAHDQATLTRDDRGDSKLTGYRAPGGNGPDTDMLAIIAEHTGGERQAAQQEPCSGDGSAPTPTAVEVEAVPIMVVSTTDEYFVLYVRHDVDGEVVEQPVAVIRGQASTTTLAENVEALPKERYRVEKYLISAPADVDGDCIDDITELGDPAGMNPVNPATAIEIGDGVLALADRETFETLAYSTSLGELIVKFVLFEMDTDRPNVYFMNTKTYAHHRDFLDHVGLEPGQRGMMHGEITYHPHLVAPDGSSGVYVCWLAQRYPFSVVERSYTLLAASMPLLEDNLAYHIPNHRLQSSQHDLPVYRESRINLVFDTDVYPETDFLALNPGEGYGLLRVMDPDERPHPRDIVIYEALPNELPRVAGVVSTVPQTPLSHINLRAVQDGVPNAFIRGALDKTNIDALIGGHVHYAVTETGWKIRAVTRAEVDAHYASSRPAAEQIPQRDLSVTAVTSLGEIGFEDSSAFGVKAANVAELRKLGFPAGTVRDGFAIPFYFYDEFMKHNDLYAHIEKMLADPDFQTDFDEQEDDLKDLRDAIKDATTPQWIIDALTAMHAQFPEGTSLRYRSSTNNEDLPGFNGAGLYDSKTQHPDETEKDGVDKSLKQVYASMWNFRAFVERDFHRIDHLTAAMGVLVHPNFSDELANGVAVSFDPTSGSFSRYYVNTQLGEDLVTNPDAHSTPEEILLGPSGSYGVLAISNQVEPGQLLMSDEQLSQLGRHLEVIHDHFERLYDPAPGARFAMEIEFKITSENILAIKQARPWVFGDAEDARRSPVSPPSSDGADTGGGGGYRPAPQPRLEGFLTVPVESAAGGVINYSLAITNYGGVVLSGVIWWSAPELGIARQPVGSGILALEETVTVASSFAVGAHHLPGPVIITVYIDSEQTEERLAGSLAVPLTGTLEPEGNVPRAVAGGAAGPAATGPAVVGPALLQEVSTLTLRVERARYDVPDTHLAHNIPDLTLTLADGSEIGCNFLTHYDATGGLTRWGWAISEVLEERAGSLTQYYQRGVVDCHLRDGIWRMERRLAWDYLGGGADGAPDLGVEPGLLSGQPGELVGPWGHRVSNYAVDGTEIGFLDFFNSLGGAASFGFPKTEARYDGAPGAMLNNPGLKPGLIRQYFQAVVMEYHPGDPLPVKLGLLGRDLRDRRYPGQSYAALASFGSAPPATVGQVYVAERVVWVVFPA